MPKVLIVEDEEDYREQIQTVLSWEGYEVRAAANGREAIDVGARFRPDVLVTDWMLRDQIHGLQVIGALRLVYGGFRAILITAFASEDLKDEADVRRVHQFIEKPFDLDRFQQAVRTAVESPPTELNEPFVAVAEIDKAGRILYANSAARELFADTMAGGSARAVAELLSSDSILDLDAASGKWHAVSPVGGEPGSWELRARRPGGSDTWMVVVRSRSRPVRAAQQLTDALLGIREGKRSRWPSNKRILIIDDDQLLRQLAVAQLQGAGAGCYAAESCNEAIRLFEQDEGIEFVLLDYDMPGIDTGQLAHRLRAIRPHVTIVGNSSMDRRAAFAEIGVSGFLFKPWSVDTLIRTFGF